MLGILFLGYVWNKNIENDLFQFFLIPSFVFYKINDLLIKNQFLALLCELKSLDC